MLHGIQIAPAKNSRELQICCAGFVFSLQNTLGELQRCFAGFGLRKRCWFFFSREGHLDVGGVLSRAASRVCGI